MLQKTLPLHAFRTTWSMDGSLLALCVGKNFYPTQTTPS